MEITVILLGGEQMRILNNNTAAEEVEYINKVLRQKKRGFKRIALEDYGINDLELLDRLNSLGYTKVKNVISRTVDITNSNIDVIYPHRLDTEPIIEDNKEGATEETALSNVNTDKLNILLDNLESLLKLIPKHNNTLWRSNDNRNISIRLDSGLYAEIKHRAERDGVTATELFNRAVEEYLNKYN